MCNFVNFEFFLYQKNLLPVNKTLLDLNLYSLSRHSVLLISKEFGYLIYFLGGWGGLRFFFLGGQERIKV